MNFGCDFDDAVAEFEFLAKAVLGSERRIERHAEPADLAETCVFIPSIGLAHIHHQIPGLLDPGIDADIAVAQWHRAVRILAGSVPHDVVRRESRLQGRVRRGGFNA